MEGLDINLEEVLSRVMKISDLNDLQEEKSRLIGKQGLITSLMKKLKEIPPEDRREFGKIVNDYKKSVEEALNSRRSELEVLAKRGREESERFDYTIPGKKRDIGSLHLITQIMEEVQSIWVSMGFEVTSLVRDRDDIL